MPNLIESSEFGDWLVAEIEVTGVQSRSADPAQALLASQRLKTLKNVKKVLREFLTLQQTMLDAASAARKHRALGPGREGEAASTGGRAALS